MKALSPVRGCYEAVCCLSERSLAIARAAEPGRRGAAEPADEGPPLACMPEERWYPESRGVQLSQGNPAASSTTSLTRRWSWPSRPLPSDGPHLPIQVRGRARSRAGLSSRLDATGPLDLPNLQSKPFPVFLLSDSRARPELVISNDQRSFCH